MGHNLSDPELGADHPSPSQSLGATLRLASQAIGLTLVLAGFYYVLTIVIAAVGMIRNPAEMTSAVEAMTHTLGLEAAAVPVGPDKIPVGKVVSAVVLVLWYAVTAFIALGLVRAGGRLVLGVISERREFLAAMKEFLVRLREEGSGHSHKSG